MLIISRNINGLKNKFGEVKELIESYNPDFLCLQKIRLNKGLEYHMAYSPAPTDLVLVGYFKTEQWEQIVTNRLYYVPAALGKGSINLVSGFEKTKYLLLHHDEDRMLLELSDAGPKFFTAKTLQDMGFEPSGEYYPPLENLCGGGFS